MHSFEVHSNESVCIKSGRLGLEQVLNHINLVKMLNILTLKIYVTMSTYELPVI